MATYAWRDGVGGDITHTSHLLKPQPPHTSTPSAEAARVGIRRFAHARRLGRLGTAMVTDHGNPPVEPYDGPRPAAASRLERQAIAAGFTAHAFETPGNARTVVEGYRATVAFRATWHRGRAESGTWHERDWRYAMIDDARPVGVSKLTRVALAGKRGAGLDRFHLSIVASPVGIPVGVTEITKRVTA